MLLKAALAGRDINLRNSKTGLSNMQSSLEEKDKELQVRCLIGSIVQTSSHIFAIHVLQSSQLGLGKPFKP